MTQFCSHCPRCEFAVSTDAQHPVCLQCGLAVATCFAPHDAPHSSLDTALRLARPFLALWLMCSVTGASAMAAFHSNALESNATLGTLAVMGVIWCAPGALRQWNTRILQR